MGSTTYFPRSFVLSSFLAFTRLPIGLLLSLKRSKRLKKPWPYRTIQCALNSSSVVGYSISSPSNFTVLRFGFAASVGFFKSSIPPGKKMVLNWSKLLMRRVKYQSFLSGMSTWLSKDASTHSLSDMSSFINAPVLRPLRSKMSPQISPFLSVRRSILAVYSVLALLSPGSKNLSRRISHFRRELNPFSLASKGRLVQDDSSRAPSGMLLPLTSSRWLKRT
mmetsp:Transcript_53532/g.113690  ORF Transcript_53532/g.113690 Transcript_53532/m.113690 type:complete len:221 (+) Transcript_53532:1232-1894(+)